MSKNSLQAVLAGLAIGVFGAAHADEARPYIYAGGVAIEYDQRDSMSPDDGGFGGAVAYGMPIKGTGFDVEFGLAYNSLKAVGNDDRDFQRHASAQFVYHWSRENWNLPWTLWSTPYLIGGLSIVQEDVADNSGSHFGLNLGGGLRHKLNSHGTAIRADIGVEQVLNNEVNPDDDRFLDVRLNVGIEVPLTTGGGTSDSDRDGVADSRDRCPNSVAGAIVDLKGCERDDDGDGVANTQDLCPDTVRGAPVGIDGCSGDADGDGVLDANDACPTTPFGVVVAANGCAQIAAPSQDSDLDGVADSIDRCANTGPNLAVDESGCAVAQTVVMSGITFDTNSATLTEGSKRELDAAVATMRGQQGLMIEIGGHTDSRGDDNYNHTLSERRADAVRGYLIERGISGTRLTAVGYGETQPRASNDTVEGRRANRRVEFKVLGQ